MPCRTMWPLAPKRSSTWGVFRSLRGSKAEPPVMSGGDGSHLPILGQPQRKRTPPDHPVTRGTAARFAPTSRLLHARSVRRHCCTRLPYARSPRDRLHRYSHARWQVRARLRPLTSTDLQDAPEARKSTNGPGRSPTCSLPSFSLSLSIRVCSPPKTVHTCAEQEYLTEFRFV